MSFIETSPPANSTWFREFERTGLPLLAHTVDAITTVRETISDLAPHDISFLVARDPPNSNEGQS